MKYLDGRAVVVTGAGRGLGAAYARHAALAGARVVVNDVDAEAASEVARGLDGAVSVAGDISTWEGARQLVATCVDTFGRIDGLVNNAGVIHVAPPHEQTEADLRRVIEINLLGTAFCGVAALEHMIAQGTGSIVNVTSGAHMGMPLVSGYAASKGGVASLTYSWAAAVQDTGVRVNAVSPDADTPLARIVAENFPGVQPGTNSIESNAPAVVYLLSDEAKDANGLVLCTGGERLTLLQRPRPQRPAVRADEWTVERVGESLEALQANTNRAKGAV